MKVKIPVVTCCILFIILIQSTVLDYIRVYNVKPNLLLVFIVCVSLLRGSTEGAVIGFFAGLFLDMACGKVIGFYALLGLYTGLILGLVNKRVYRDNILVGVFLTFVTTLVYETIVYFFGIFLNNQQYFIFALSSIILPEAIYNSAASIFVFAFVIKLNEKLESMNKSSRKY